jgi:hypothetical protein
MDESAGRAKSETGSRERSMLPDPVQGRAWVFEGGELDPASRKQLERLLPPGASNCDGKIDVRRRGGDRALDGGANDSVTFHWAARGQMQPWSLGTRRDMNQSSCRTRSTNTGQDLLVGLCGFVTSLVTAVILWWAERAFGFAFYSLMFWFIVPVGALVSGCAGASGYYAGARIFNHRPRPLLLLNVLLASVGTFFAIHYLAYITLETEGEAISSYLSFAQYLDIGIRSTSMKSIRWGGSTGGLGSLGYTVAILQILGFAVGGLVVYGCLVSVPYCERCSRYFASKGKQIRYTGDAEGLQASSAQFYTDFGDGAIASAIQNHSMFGKPTFQRDNHLRSVIVIRHCKHCGQHWVKYMVEKQTDSDWREIPDFTAIGFTDQVVDVFGPHSQ